MGEVEKERLVRLGGALFEKGEGVLGDEIRSVALACDRLGIGKVDLDIRQLAVAKVIHVSAEESDEFIEALFQRRKLRLVAKMPFSENAVVVALRFQARSQTGVFGGQSEITAFGEANSIVVAPDVASPDCTLHAANPLW